MSHSSGQTEENKRILKELEDQKRKFAMKSQHNIPSSGNKYISFILNIDIEFEVPIDHKYLVN